jgi:hypothetical protein
MILYTPFRIIIRGTCARPFKYVWKQSGYIDMIPAKFEIFLCLPILNLVRSVPFLYIPSGNITTQTIAKVKTVGKKLLLVLSGNEQLE